MELGWIALGALLGLAFIAGGAAAYWWWIGRKRMSTNRK